MGKKLGFQLESGLANQYLTDSKYIKDSYYVVADLAARDALAVTAESDLSGALCYVEDARTEGQKTADVEPFGRYYKYIITIVNEEQVRGWQALKAEDIQLNDSQQLSEILPTILSGTSSYIKFLLLSEDQYFELQEKDPLTLYLVYRPDQS